MDAKFPASLQPSPTPGRCGRCEGQKMRNGHEQRRIFGRRRRVVPRVNPFWLCLLALSAFATAKQWGATSTTRSGCHLVSLPERRVCMCGIKLLRHLRTAGPTVQHATQRSLLAASCTSASLRLSSGVKGALFFAYLLPLIEAAVAISSLYTLVRP